MSKFVLIKKTLFQRLERDQGSESYRGPIRRPYMGITGKRDTYGSLSVLKKNGQTVDLLDYASPSKNGKTPYYSNFLIQKIQRQENEKMQIQETWGDDFLIVYGKKPLILNVSGTLISSDNFPWEAEFWFNYEHTLRATRLAEAGARIFLEVDNLYVTGYMANAQAARDEQFQNNVPFAFSLFVTSIGYTETQKLSSQSFQLQPTTTGKIPLQNTKSSVLEGEIANAGDTRQELNDLLGTTKQKNIRNRRREILEPLKEFLEDAPIKHAEITGVLGKQTPITYGKPTNKGWTNQGTGQSIKELWSPTYPDSKSNQNLMDAARSLLNTITSDETAESVRNLAGTGEAIFKKAIGIGELPANLTNQALSSVQRRMKELSDLGSGFYSSAMKVMDDTTYLADGMASLQQGVVSSVQQARSAIDTMKMTGKAVFRLPRPGIFFLGGE